MAVPSGDPDSIRRAAAQLRRLSARALDSGALTGQARGELAMVWTGDAAEQAAAELATVAARGRPLLSQIDRAGVALAAYSDILDSSMRQARSLQRRESTARLEHERLVAAASALTEPAASQARALADDGLRARLAAVHREHGVVMDRLMAAAARCSRALSSLTARAVVTGPGRGPSAVGAALVDDLPLVQRELTAASRPPE
ncbi:hypothetical protein, partial [Intrasporangium sp.]|uniref:hypothetical protein n=1 Tax=Intrasporangium sp. TaxID=1925024 RepID=UPI002939D2E7